MAGKVRGSKSTRTAAQVRLTRRVADLAVSYIGAGRATPKLQKAVGRLKDDIEAWRDRTGNRDLRATTMTRRIANEGEWTCKRCDWIMFSLGRICFLVGCDPEWKSCSYICFNLPKEPLPVS